MTLGFQDLRVREEVRQGLRVHRGQERIPWRELERDEPDERDPDQDRDRDEDASNDVGAHRTSYAMVRIRPMGARLIVSFQ